MENTVTVAILTFNAEEHLTKLLKSVISQKTDRDIEILVIDSGSTDNTLKILADYPQIKLHQIPNDEFGHGKTRNLALRMASGKFVLFLTQDAVPSHKNWLEGMVEPFSISDKVAAVIGKQVPWPATPVTIKREVVSVFRSLGPDDGITISRQTATTNKLGLTNTFLSNTNSAVRADILKKIPFRDVDYAEDQGLGVDLLAAGYYKAYSSLGAVNHAHIYGIREYFHRKFDEYVGLHKTVGYTTHAGMRELVIGSLKATLLDWIFLVRDKQFTLIQKIINFVKAPFYNIGLRLAIRAAAKSKHEPRLESKLSLEARSRKPK